MSFTLSVHAVRLGSLSLSGLQSQRGGQKRACLPQQAQKKRFKTTNRSTDQTKKWQIGVTLMQIGVTSQRKKSETEVTTLYQNICAAPGGEWGYVHSARKYTHVDNTDDHYQPSHLGSQLGYACVSAICVNVSWLQRLQDSVLAGNLSLLLEWLLEVWCRCVWLLIDPEILYS